MSGRIFVLPALQELEELLRPALLKEAHQRALHSLHLGAGNLGDLAIPVDKAASDLLELQVTRHIGVDEYLGQLPRCDDELGDQVHVVVAIAAELSGRLLVGAEVTVELLQFNVLAQTIRESAGSRTHLGQVKTGAVSTVVIITIHVENLLALN